MPPRGIDIDRWGEIIGVEPYKPVWFSFDYGVGRDSRLGFKGCNHGHVQRLTDEVNLKKVHDKLMKNDFSGIATFYVGLACFFGDKLKDHFEFVDKPVTRNRFRTIIEKLTCQRRTWDNLCDILDAEFDFNKFLKAAHDMEGLHFDLESALDVYRLQGDDAIFGIMCQVFYANKGVESLFVDLINDLPVDLRISFDNLVSGCYFPVAVSPKIEEKKWEMTDNGWFLYGRYGDEWGVLDCVGAGNVYIGRYPLANRLNFFASGGKTVPYIICNNWGEVVEATRNFGGNSLIRDLRNDLFTRYWFKFGDDSRLVTTFKNGSAGGSSNYMFDVKFGDGERIDGRFNAAKIDLFGNFCGWAEEEDVVFSDDEVLDWMRLGKLLSKDLNS